MRRAVKTGRRGNFLPRRGIFLPRHPVGGNAFNAFTEHPSFIGAPIQVYRTPIVGFHPTFSRHGIAQILSALALLIWLNEKVGFHPTFSRHGIAQSLSALALRIWLNEKVEFHL